MANGLLAWVLGGWEVALIVVAILVLFGGRKLPELARGLGKGMRIFKKEIQGVKDELDDAINSEPDEDDDTSKTARKSPEAKSSDKDSDNNA